MNNVISTKSIPYKESIQKYLDHVFCIFCSILLSPTNYFIKIECSLDYSWMTAINLGVKNQLEFGKEFIFNYGPLGFLCTRLPLELPIKQFLFYDLYNIVLVYIILLIYSRVTNNYLKYLFILIPILFIKNGISYYWSLPSFYFWIVLTLISYCINYESKNKTILLFVAVFTSIIGSLTKLNFGLIFIFIIISTLFYLFITKKITPKILGFLIIFFVANFILFYKIIYNVDIVMYLTNSLSLINSYNDAMFVEPSSSSVLLFILDAVIIFFVACFIIFHFIYHYINYKLLKNYDFFTPFFVLLSFYILFKHTSVRSHIDEFHRIAAPLTAVLFFISTKSNITKMINCMLFSVTCIYGLVYYHTSHVEVFKENPIWKDISIASKIQSMLNYKKQYNKGRNIMVNSACVFIPDEIMKKIDKNTIDIFPFEVTAMQIYKLNYKPRPIFQTYQVTDSKLDKANSEFIESSNAPKFILYNLFGLDNRGLLHDEVYTKISLLSNYSLTGYNFPDVYGNISLLEKRSKPIKYNIHLINKSNFLIGDSLIIPNNDNLLLLKAKVKYSTIGWLKRMLYIPSQLNIIMYLEDGSLRTHKCILPIVNEGIIINRYIDSYGQGPERDLLIYEKGQKNKKVVSIKFTTSEVWGFKPKFEAEFWEVKYKKESEETPRYKQLSSVFKSKNQISGQIEVLDTTSNYVCIKGWAYIENSQNCCNQINLVAESVNGSYIVPASLSSRFDVVQNKGLPYELRNIGFSGLILKSNLPKGMYKVNLQATDNFENISIVQTGIKFEVK